MNLSSELSSCSVDSEYLGLSPGVRSQKADVHGTVYDNRILTTLSSSRGGLLCQGQTSLGHWFLCWFGADFKAPIFLQPKKDLQGFLDCNLGYPVPQSNTYHPYCCSGFCHEIFSSLEICELTPDLTCFQIFHGYKPFS